jgi:hypothetical protein
MGIDYTRPGIAKRSTANANQCSYSQYRLTSNRDPQHHDPYGTIYDISVLQRFIHNSETACRLMRSLVESAVTRRT